MAGNYRTSGTNIAHKIAKLAGAKQDKELAPKIKEAKKQERIETMKNTVGYKEKEKRKTATHRGNVEVKVAKKLREVKEQPKGITPIKSATKKPPLPENPQAPKKVAEYNKRYQSNKEVKNIVKKTKIENKNQVKTEKVRAKTIKNKSAQADPNKRKEERKARREKGGKK